jgi:hypothetical protein
VPRSRGTCGTGGRAASRPWLVPDLSAARSEANALTIYAAMNEDEALPYWSN